jgi:hypothetical protein
VLFSAVDTASLAVEKRKPLSVSAGENVRLGLYLVLPIRFQVLADTFKPDSEERAIE